MGAIWQRRALAGFMLGVAAFTLPASADGLAEVEIDTLVTSALQEFDTPGMSVAIVEDGKVTFLKGYGSRDLEAKKPVTPKTLFRLASTTKAFTAAALAILVDEGKIGWNDKVTDHLPTFRMKDPWVTDAFTVRDLLTHHSGLWNGAGDMLLWPEPSSFTAAEIVASLATFEPLTSFRSSYAYNNVLYIAAGELVAAVSGVPYADFVERRILKPLGIACYWGPVPAKALKDAAVGYDMVDGKLMPHVRNGIDRNPTASVAAGGGVCNAEGMAKWMVAQLDGTHAPFSEKQRDEMWASQALLPLSKRMQEIDGTAFRAYGLGWRLADVNGVKTVSHTGTLGGWQAYVMLVPSKNLGIALFNNGSHEYARQSVMQGLLKSWLAPDEKRDWVAWYAAEEAKEEAEAKAKQWPEPEVLPLTRPLAIYAGSYVDDVMGDVTVTLQDEQLEIAFARMPALKGTLTPIRDGLFRTVWTDPTAAGRIYVAFPSDAGGQVVALTLDNAAGAPNQADDYASRYFRRRSD
ncbi:serine hydrolase [Gimibacter soli]|uniref:Serine hydrolase n=1 Tax=Gimibacter soli TaxID=3024400 RepID=A0AAE9XQ59_9PROT|nr:serine hydrolase [Gimibacter soli]WCL55238.1 serine hydrolase [Gimibacter soli]